MGLWKWVFDGRDLEVYVEVSLLKTVVGETSLFAAILIVGEKVAANTSDTWLTFICMVRRGSFRLNSFNDSRDKN